MLQLEIKEKELLKYENEIAPTFYSKLQMIKFTSKKPSCSAQYCTQVKIDTTVKLGMTWSELYRHFVLATSLYLNY